MRTSSSSLPSLTLGEQVLTIASGILFKKEHWQGIKKDNLDYYLDLIKKCSQFKLRKDVENNSSFRQIIPYIIFNFQNQYFLYNYLEKAGEKRLINDCQLGVAGHINPIDVELEEDTLRAGMMREWNEEVAYGGNLIEKKLIGILNDERRQVESVHLGLLYHFTGDSPQITIKEKDKIEGGLIKLEDLSKYLENANGWPEIIYKEYLSNIK
jgi:predicted NUDIX family phosphoesterase